MASERGRGGPPGSSAEEDPGHGGGAWHRGARPAKPDEADHLADVVPRRFTSIAACRRDDGIPVKPHSFGGLRGQAVIVRANGFLYRGTLVGADEAELYLRGEFRWVVLPLASVTDVRVDDTRDVPLGWPREAWVPPAEREDDDLGPGPIRPASFGRRAADGNEGNEGNDGDEGNDGSDRSDGDGPDAAFADRSNDEDSDTNA